MTKARTAIVTGAGKRVGREIARALLATVGPWSPTSTTTGRGARMVQSRSLRISPIPTAPRRSSPRRRPAAGAVAGQQCGAIRVGRFGEFSAEEFDVHMAVNVRAPALLDRALRRRARQAETR